jgi:hypothetical protein
MNTMLVWFLVSTGGYYSGLMNYSPPFATVQECERVQKILKDADNFGHKFYTQCIQMTVVK